MPLPRPEHKPWARSSCQKSVQRLVMKIPRTWIIEPTIMVGINQTIMMALSMVVIASLVSAPGLGLLVLRGINNLELGTGLVAGMAIVLLAIVLDRVSKSAVRRASWKTQ